MKKMKIATILLLAFYAHGVAAIVSATLPASRSVQVGTTATIFTTVINPDPQPALDCGISLQSNVNADLFFQTTDPATNELTGSPNVNVTIAGDAAQSFLIGITPNTAFEPTDIAFNFTCSNTPAAPSITGLNTLLLSASVEPVADIVAIALTPSRDGVAQLPQENSLGFFTMASVNVGAADTVSLTARTSVPVEGTLLVCETDPLTSACLEPPVQSLDVAIAENDTSTFAVFASSFLALPLDPANGRVFVEFTDSGGQIRGSTSVALSGGGPDTSPVFPQDAQGDPSFPDSATSQQFSWIIDRIRDADVSIADINERFVPAFDANNLLGFFDSLNQTYSNLDIVEVVTVTPILISVVIDDGEGAQPLSVTVRTRLSDGVITQFAASNAPATNQRAQDQNLTPEQVADTFETLADGVSLMVAEVDSDNQCTPLLERNMNTRRTIGSTFKVYSLAALADAVAAGDVSLDQNLPLNPNLFAGGSNLNTEPAGTPLSVFDHARLMIGVSDNTTTDHIHDLLDQSRLDQSVITLQHTEPDVFTPLLSINQQFALFQVFSIAQAEAYLAESEAEQQRILQEELIPLGSLVTNTAPTMFNDSLFTRVTKLASPLDLCNAYANARTTYPVGSEAFSLIDQSMSTSTGLTGLRNTWDRVWFKGGSLAAGTADGVETRVLSVTWLVESAERGRFVVTASANNVLTGGIDQPAMLSLSARLLQLLDEGAFSQ